MENPHRSPTSLEGKESQLPNDAPGPPATSTRRAIRDTLQLVLAGVLEEEAGAGHEPLDRTH